MKSLSKVSLTLFSLLALSGISASANSKNNHQHTNGAVNQLKAPISQGSDIDQANSHSDNNITHVSKNSIQNNDNSSEDLNNTAASDNPSNSELNNNQDSQTNSTQFVNVNQLHHHDYNYKGDYHSLNHHLSYDAKNYKTVKHHHNLNIMRLSNANANNFVKKHNVTSYKKHNKHNKKTPLWFIDGLNHKQLKARGWIVRHESGGHWNILSYGHICVGRYQLAPGYLGYKHGHVNLDHRHQTIVADRYVRRRYGSWVHAQHFWKSHHWY